MSYSLFKQYARSFDEDLAGDIVHDIFLNYYNKHGRSIFEIPTAKSKRWVYKVIRNHYLNLQYHKTKWVDPETISGEDGISFFEIVPDYRPLFIEHIIVDELDVYCRRQVRRLAYRKAKHKTSYHKKKIAQVYERTYELLGRGYKISEIAEKLKIDYRQANYYKNQIKKLLGMRINNPFAGNKAEPVKKVTLKQYEEKYKQEYVIDFDRQWCDENETTALAVHKDREEYILIKKTKD